MREHRAEGPPTRPQQYRVGLDWAVTTDQRVSCVLILTTKVVIPISYSLRCEPGMETISLKIYLPCFVFHT